MTDSPSSLEQRAFFLIELSRLLASSLTDDRMLSRIARLAVPLLGDLCAVDVQDADGTLRRAACAHVDPTKEGVAYEARARYGFSATAPADVPAVLASRQSTLVSPATAADLQQVTQNPEQLQLFLQLGVRAWMIVPLIARERAFGAVTFAITESAGRYDRTDLLFAEAVVSQIAVARDNAGLYRAAETAREAAEAASSAKDQFLSTLSHELRTPLNAVYGWATMLERGQLGEAQARRALQIILRNVHAQVRLIDDLLDMARVTSGKLRLAVQPLDLRRVVEDALDAVRPAAEAKQIRLQPVLASPGGPVSGDPDRLQQVVWNLLSNAVKFTPKGGRVQIQLQRVHSHVEIVISDTGQGIPPELLPYIFDRLRQGDSTSTRAHSGLGLGLALVRHLVELHGGIVFAESPGDGLGATFVVKLPLMIAYPPEPAPDGAPLSRQPTTAQSLEGLRILVVDDDPTAVELNRAFLGQAGADVRGCTSGAEALQILQQWRPAVLVSDIEMPGLDGYTLLRQLRALDPDQGGKTPAIALSAYNQPEDRVRSLRAGFNFHVSKPVDPNELTAIVASLAGRVG
ncbi:MAG TPA: ATP-binding protein [Methylomirabilota bacterium]|nr:ATP-binding protein [Methylomirabilota bacterium]